MSYWNLKYLLQDFQILVLDQLYWQLPGPRSQTSCTSKSPMRTGPSGFKRTGSLQCGRRAAKIIPACCTIAIRNKYPDPEGKYKVFWLQKRIINKFYLIIIVFISSKTDHKCSIPNTYYKIAWDLSVNKIGCWREPKMNRFVSPSSLRYQICL